MNDKMNTVREALERIKQMQVEDDVQTVANEALSDLSSMEAEAGEVELTEDEIQRIVELPTIYGKGPYATPTKDQFDHACSCIRRITSKYRLIPR